MNTLTRFLHAYLLNNEPQVTPAALAQALRDSFDIAPKGRLDEANRDVAALLSIIACQEHLRPEIAEQFRERIHDRQARTLS